MKVFDSITCSLAALTLLCFSSVASAAGGDELAAGKSLYVKHCSQCHGENGDANAPAAPYFTPRPRDFTSGKYKIRHTATGELPLDSDIKNAIRHGLAFTFGVGAYTAMPPWPKFSDPEVTALTAYLKSFAKDFSDPEYNNPKEIVIPDPPSSSEESIARGRGVYEKNECIKCHGEYGRGDGKSAPTLKDDWGHHIRPADLTKRWTFRGGGSPKDIFRTVSTGLNGTPMPAYGDTLSVDDRWDLVNYLLSLSSREAPSYNKSDSPVLVVPFEGEMNLENTDALHAAFDAVPKAYIAVVGQVMEPGRNFAPGVNELVVQGIYNKDEIALRVTWHDMIADVSAENSPSLEVPRFDPASLVKEAQGGDDEDPFADFEEEEEADPFADDMAGEAGDSGTGAEGHQSAYSDAVAIQFPVALEENFKKPYFLFGDSKRAVSLWFLDLAKKAPERFIGKGSSSLAKGDSTLASHADYRDGEWSVIIKGPRTGEGQVSFEEGSMIPLAFSVWDGFSEERGSKRGVTSWYNLYLEPMEKESPLGSMLAYGGGLFALEVLLVGLVRRKNKI